MGSLMPGWEKDPASPEGFGPATMREGEQKLGYFAKLEKSRSMRPAEPVPFVASVPRAYTLRRQSVPIETAAANAVREIDQPSSPGKHRKSHDQQTDHSLAHSLAEHAGSGSTRPRPTIYTPTDWTAELRSLRGNRTHEPEHQHAHERHPPKKDQERSLERFSFSRHMEHSDLNYMQPAQENDPPASFAPQTLPGGTYNQYHAAGR